MQNFDQFLAEYTNTGRIYPKWLLNNYPDLVTWLRSKHEIIERLTAHNALMAAQGERLHNENVELKAQVQRLLNSGIDFAKYEAAQNEAKALRAANDVLQAAFNDRSIAALPAREDPAKLKNRYADLDMFVAWLVDEINSDQRHERTVDELHREFIQALVNYERFARLKGDTQ